MADALLQRARVAVRGLSPGYFALVMATGVVSIGMALEGQPAVSRVLLVLAAAAFVVLLVLTTWRLLGFRRELAEDFTHPLRSFGFYSFVAGANVLGVRIAMDGELVWPAILLVVSAAIWLVRGYAVPWTTRLDAAERPIVAAANGTWFMWAVAGQSIAVAAATLELHWRSAGLALVAVGAWSIGLFLYVVAGVLVVMRLLLHDFSAEELTPPYWVAMGAAAITVLAGAKVVEMPHEPAVDAVRGLVGGTGLVLWWFATWLVPGLFATGWWRHVTHRVPLRYDASLWCIVFPLGMYSVASSYLGDADHLPILARIGAVWIWVAFAAWALVALAMVHHLWRTVARPVRRPLRRGRRGRR